MKNKILIATTAGIITLSAIGFGIYTVTETAKAEEFNQQDKLGKFEELKSIKNEVNTAIENKDYQAWKSAVSKMPNDKRSVNILDKIDSEEKFNKLVKLYELKKEAQSIEEELGIDEKLKDKIHSMREKFHEMKEINN